MTVSAPPPSGRRRPTVSARRRGEGNAEVCPRPLRSLAICDPSRGAVPIARRGPSRDSVQCAPRRGRRQGADSRPRPPTAGVGMARAGRVSNAADGAAPWTARCRVADARARPPLRAGWTEGRAIYFFKCFKVRAESRGGGPWSPRPSRPVPAPFSPHAAAPPCRLSRPLRTTRPPCPPPPAWRPSWRRSADRRVPTPPPR